jgi:hypothetical protein
MDRGTNAAVERAYSAAVEQLAAANEKLYQTEIKYQTEVNGQNSQSVGPPKQSGWSKFWNGDRSDPNKYFQF